MARKVRLSDVATRCGVSVSTASRALASEKGVRSDLRQSVLAAARELGYPIPTLRTGDTIVVAASGAAMLDYSRNQFTTHVLEGLRERAEALGYRVETRPVADVSAERKLVGEALADARVAGLLFLTLDDEEMLEPARGVAKPVVLVNGDDPLMRLSSVAPCNRAASAMATRFLRRLGHERILFLTRPGRRTIERRLQGWRDAMADLPPDVTSDLVVSVEDWLPDLAGEAVARRVAERGLDFTAILAAADSLAGGAMIQLVRDGIDVPAQVSVVGMDDLPGAVFHSPPLTSVHIPMRDIGAVAIDILCEEMGNPGRPARRVELACSLIERASATFRPLTLVRA